MLGTSKMNGYRQRFEFPNGYTASVVCHDNSYGNEEGLFEVALMRDGVIVYGKWPVVSELGVTGYCTFAEVAFLLSEIEGLPAD